MGIVGTNTITNLTLVSGVDQVYTAGTNTQVFIPIIAARENAIVTWGTAQHNQDGSHAAVTATSVAATGTVSGVAGTFSGDVSDNATTLKTIRSETQFDYIASGCVLSGTGYGSTLGWSMTSGVVYIGGKRLTVAAASGTVTASKDTYFDLLDPGSGTVATLVNTSGNIVANNAASPALAASSVRAGIIISAATIAAATSVNQGQETMVLPIASSVPYAVTDSLGNLICPRDPNRRVLGYRQITSNFSTASTSFVQVTGLSLPVIIPTGRKIRISVYAFNVSINAISTPNISIWDGVVASGTQLQNWSVDPYTATAGASLSESVVFTPSSSSKTFNIGMKMSASTGNIVAASTQPAYVMVELV